MIIGLDHVVVAVEDLEVAATTYRDLLGRGPSWRGSHPGQGTENVLFRLANTYLELLAAPGRGAFGDAVQRHLQARGEGLFALAFASEDAELCARVLRERGLHAGDPVAGEGRDLTSGAVRRWRNVMLSEEETRGVFLFVIEHLSPASALPPAAARGREEACVHALDHVVVHTSEAEASLALYRDVLGLRLALDRSFEERGVRLMFLRTGGVTVELAAPLAADSAPGQPDQLWGLAWQVPDAAAARSRLVASEVGASPVREGHKPGTRVFSSRGETCGVATLWIEPTSLFSSEPES